LVGEKKCKGFYEHGLGIAVMICNYWRERTL